MAENKVQFGLKNVHYAVYEEGTWATPVAVPGAVSLSLEAEGEVTPFYADNIVYFQTVADNGYTGDLEMARFSDQMLQDVWGYELTATDSVLIENSNVQPKAFALLFQVDGDSDNQYYCLYNCSGTRPGIGGETVTETKEPTVQTSSISAVPLENGKILARTTANTSEAVKTAWFDAVYQENVGG